MLSVTHSIPKEPAEINLCSEASVNPNQLTIEHVQEILLKEKYVCDRALGHGSFIYRS